MSMVNNTVHPKPPRPGPAATAGERHEPPAAATVRRNGRYANDPVSLGLRKLWHQIENEPVPAEFLDLLDAIDAARDPGTAIPPASDTASDEQLP